MSTTIGPFTNVPAPGDDVKSAWAQQLTQYAVDDAAALAAHLAAVQEIAAPRGHRVSIQWPLTTTVITASPQHITTAQFVADPSRLYKVTATVPEILLDSGAPAEDIISVTVLSPAFVLTPPFLASGIVTMSPNTRSTMTIFGITRDRTSDVTLSLSVWCASVASFGHLRIAANPWLIVEDIGAKP